MRTPTPIDDQLRWWRAALGGDEPEIVNDEPQPGWYKRKLVKGGVFVGARIWLEQVIDADTGELERDEILRCVVHGRLCDPIAEWQWLAAAPITKEEFDYLQARYEWALRNDPHGPEAHPERPVDWLRD